MPQFRRYSQQLENASLIERPLPLNFFSPARCPRLFRNAPVSCLGCHVALSYIPPGCLQKGIRHEGEGSRPSASRAFLAGIRVYILVMVHFMPTTVRPQRWEKAFNGSPPGMSLISEYSQACVGKKVATPLTLMCDTEADADAYYAWPYLAPKPFATVVTAV